MNMSDYLYGYTRPELASDMYGRVGFDISGGNLESIYNNAVAEQRALNELQMAREDSAHQREVADLRKAGLNPWLSSTSGGLSSSPQTAPHKSALETLVQVLTSHNNAIGGMNRDTLSAFNTGIKAAIPFLAMFGL